MKKSNNNIGLICIKKVDINKVRLMKSLIISKFRNWFNYFVTKNKFDNFMIEVVVKYHILSGSIIKKLSKLRIKNYYWNI